MGEFVARAVAEVAGGEADGWELGGEGVEEGLDPREDFAAFFGEGMGEGFEEGVADVVEVVGRFGVSGEDFEDDGAVRPSVEADAAGSVGDGDDLFEGTIEGGAPGSAGGDEGEVDIEEEEWGHGVQSSDGVGG